MKTISLRPIIPLDPLKITKILSPNQSSTLQSQFLFVRTTHSIHCIGKKEILYLQANGNYTKIVSKDGSEILASKTLKYFGPMLDQRIFFRTHQSYIVNLSFMQQLKMTDSYELVLQNGRKIPVSRSKQKSIQNILQN